MFTCDSLAEIHRRAHKSLEILISHCATLSEDEINRTFKPFGEATIRLNLHHIIGSELYWIEVLKGRIQADDDAPDYPTIASLEKYRVETFKNTRAYLETVSQDQLNLPAEFETWGGNRYTLVPANIVVRPIVHIYHHAGQISIMCKMLGKPAPSFDYPLG